MYLFTLITVHVDPKFPHTSNTQKLFLSWQSKHFHPNMCLFLICTNMCLFLICTAWDLLRIDVYGFIAFCKWFFRTYPTYFISPIRLSGSAVESLFSQYKHSAGGKLDSVNYTTARAACLVRQSVATHCSGKGYRDENLHTTEITLKRKVYASITDNKSLTDTQAT